MSSYLIRCVACVELLCCLCRVTNKDGLLRVSSFHVEGENVLFGVVLFSCIVTRASTFLLRAVNCLACVDCLPHGVGSLRFQACSEVAVRLTSLVLFHSLYVA